MFKGKTVYLLCSYEEKMVINKVKFFQKMFPEIKNLLLQALLDPAFTHSSTEHFLFSKSGKCCKLIFQKVE